MAQLVQLRQRIKAIETIKKITHAMRLISMSTHSRLKHKEEPLRTYNKSINELFTKIQRVTPDWKHPILSPASNANATLIIIIGSSKGLCGGFNTSLFNYYQKYRAHHLIEHSTLIVVGRRAISYCQEHKMGPIASSFEDLNAHNLISVAHSITQAIMLAPRPYASVLVFSNHFKTFFNQKPQVSQLIPFTHKQFDQPSQTNNAAEDYIWEQKAEEILDILAHQSIDATIQFLLFQSLLAELAARFLSMDSSTRNAQTLLDTAKLDYNKLRQAKITKELSELSGSF
jgi:F-type H+-transporting ATPase subunit gamma